MASKPVIASALALGCLAEQVLGHPEDHVHQHGDPPPPSQVRPNGLAAVTASTPAQQRSFSLISLSGVTE